jgi:hypothetical protein
MKIVYIPRMQSLTEEIVMVYVAQMDQDGAVGFIYTS